MLLTLEQILSGHRATQKLMSNGAGSAGVSAIAALRIARAARVLAAEAKAFDAARIALVKELSHEPDESGNYAVASDSMQAFEAGLAELLAEEIDLDLEAINLDDFGESQIGLTALVGLEWLIDDKPRPKKKRKKGRK